MFNALRSLVATGLNLVMEAAVQAAFGKENNVSVRIPSSAGSDGPADIKSVAAAPTPEPAVVATPSVAPTEAPPAAAPVEAPPIKDGPTIAEMLEEAKKHAKVAEPLVKPAKPAKIKCATLGCKGHLRPGLAPFLPGAVHCLQCTNKQLLGQGLPCYWRRTADGMQMVCQNPQCTNRFPLGPKKPGSNEPRPCCKASCWRAWDEAMRPHMLAFRMEGKLPQMVTVGESEKLVVARATFKRTCQNEDCGKTFTVQFPLAKNAMHCMDCHNAWRMEGGKAPFLFVYEGEGDLMVCQNPNHRGPNRIFEPRLNEFGGLHTCCSADCTTGWKRAGDGHIAAFERTRALPKITVIRQKQTAHEVKAQAPTKPAETPPAAPATTSNDPTEADIRRALNDGTFEKRWPVNAVDNRPNGDVHILIIVDEKGRQKEFLLKAKMKVEEKKDDKKASKAKNDGAKGNGREHHHKGHRGESSPTFH